MPKVLVVDDDRAILHMVAQSLKKLDVEVVTCRDADQLVGNFSEATPDVVLLDVMLPGVSGIEAFKQLREVDKRVPVIFITASESSDLAIEAMQLGALDYVAKPLNLPILNGLVEQAIEIRRLMNVPIAVGTTDVKSHAEVFVGRSPEMLEVFKSIGRVASQDVTVLIRGESGTGKELVARAIYHHSLRSEEPFMAVNCAAMVDTLLESELFGHEKGAFTNADRRRIGKFEQCNGGTIFLDEVGDMSPLLQGKVLRLLQEQTFERVGGNETISTDVRIVAATNRDLEAMVEEGAFRADLFYRLNGLTITLPSLRERQSDIRMLLEHFLSIARIELEKPEIEGISPEAVAILERFPWPGNVRELQSVIRRAVLRTTGPVIVPAFLPPEVSGESKETSRVATDRGDSPEGLAPCDIESYVEQRLKSGTERLYDETLEVVERYLFARVLQETGGNQSRASRILGITRGKVRDRIAAYGITFESNVNVDE